MAVNTVLHIFLEEDQGSEDDDRAGSSIFENVFPRNLHAVSSPVFCNVN